MTWLLIFVVGLLLGSFANVCIHRIPAGESIVSPRSRCPRCKAPIAWWDNVPILSFLILGRRCRFCRAPISVRYPVVELTNGVLYVLVVTLHGLTWRSAAEMAFVTLLLILAFIDFDHQILPDVLTLPGTAAAVAASLLGGGPSIAESLLAAIGMYVLFAFVAWSYKLLRGVDGLGQGDWKMAALLGAFLGWQKALFAVFAGAVSGSIVGLVLITVARKDAQHPMPFGTFLALGGILAILIGDPVLTWYRGFFPPP